MSSKGKKILSSFLVFTVLFLSLTSVITFANSNPNKLSKVNKELPADWFKFEEQSISGFEPKKGSDLDSFIKALEDSVDGKTVNIIIPSKTSDNLPILEIKDYILNETKVSFNQDFRQFLRKYGLYKLDINYEITLPKDLKRIGDHSFLSLENLRTVHMGNKVNSIGESAFARSGIEEINIPGSLPNIGFVFSNCKNLRKVKLNEGLKSIDDFSFQYSGIEELELPKSVKSIGKLAFYKCSSLTELRLKEGLEIIGDQAFRDTGLRSLKTPNSLKTIEHAAFYESKNLAKVSLNEGLEKIGERAFQSTAVTDIEIPSTVEILEKATFLFCKNLKSVKLNEGLKHIRKWNFQESNLEAIQTPNSLESISEGAFFRCYNLTDVKLNEGLNFLGDWVFQDSGIKSIEVPSTVKTIPYWTFANCSNLRQVRLNNGLETVGEMAFYNTSLKNIEIPKTVTKLEEGIFNGVYTLDKLVILGDEKNLSGWDKTFIDESEPTIVSYEDNRKVLKNKEINNDFKNFIEVEEREINSLNGQGKLTFLNNDLYLKNIDQINYTVVGDVVKNKKQSGSLKKDEIQKNMEIKFNIDTSKKDGKVYVEFTNIMNGNITDKFKSHKIKVNIPEEPEEPEKPEKPEKPEVPEWPEFPEKPEEPEKPVEPVKKHHKAYIRGYVDKTIRANNEVSREEAAAIVYRAFDFKGLGSHKYGDVQKGRWSEKYIGKLTEENIFEGYVDGSFKPSKGMTRAEFAKTIARYKKLEKVEGTYFSDVKNHWAEGYINALAEAGIIQGFQGNFLPSKKITRAEMITMINNTMERNLKIKDIDRIKNPFKDLNKDAWYYNHIIESSIDHDFIIKNNKEEWLK